MNIKALERVFLKEANRLIKRAYKRNLDHRTVEGKMEESTERMAKHYEKIITDDVSKKTISDTSNKKTTEE